MGKRTVHKKRTVHARKPREKILYLDARRRIHHVKRKSIIWQCPNSAVKIRSINHGRDADHEWKAIPGRMLQRNGHTCEGWATDAPRIRLQ